MEELEDNLAKIVSGLNSLGTVSTAGEDASPAGSSFILSHGSLITCTKYFHQFNLLFQVLYFPSGERDKVKVKSSYYSVVTYTF